MGKQGAKAVVPRLRFPEFRTEPAWETWPVGDVCQLYQPETIPSSSFVVDGLHLVYGASGVIGRLDAFNHENAEVIIGCRGICGNASITDPKSWITGNAMVIKPLDDELLKPFLFHLLDAVDLSPVISGSAQPQITRQGLRRFAISVPVRDEQEKIADCLTSLDEVIAVQVRKVETLKDHKRCLMQQLFPREGETMPRLRFPEFRDAGEWQEIALGDLTEIVRGGSPRPIDAFLTHEADGLNWLKIGDVDRDAKYIIGTEEKVRSEALSKTRVVKPGDFILSNSMSFGRPYISTIETCIHDGWIAITRIPAALGREFLYYSLLSARSQTYFLDQAAGSGVQNLNKDIMQEKIEVLKN